MLTKQTLRRMSVDETALAMSKRAESHYTTETYLAAPSTRPNSFTLQIDVAKHDRFLDRSIRFIFINNKLTVIRFGSYSKVDVYLYKKELNEKWAEQS